MHRPGSYSLKKSVAALITLVRQFLHSSVKEQIKTTYNLIHFFKISIIKYENEGDIVLDTDISTKMMISRIIGYTRQIFLYMEKEGVIHADFVENQAVFLKNCISQLVFLLYVQRCSKTVPEKQILGRFQGNENIG